MKRSSVWLADLPTFFDTLMIGFSITEPEVEDLLAFFDSLNDWDFVCDERFSDPFGKVPMHPRCASAP